MPDRHPRPSTPPTDVATENDDAEKGDGIWQGLHIVSLVHLPFNRWILSGPEMLELMCAIVSGMMCVAALGMMVACPVSGNIGTWAVFAWMEMWLGG